MVDNSVHCHDHNHNHYHNHDQRKLSNEQLSNHDFLREQLDRVCKTARLAATVSLKKNITTITTNTNCQMSTECHLGLDLFALQNSTFQRRVL